MKECDRCDFNNEDYGCTCPHSNKWYACPIENKKPENVKALREWVEELDKHERNMKNEYYRQCRK